jgi:hypothetical protein
MPSIPHEAPLELIRRRPQLAAVLLRGLGVAVPDDAIASLGSAEMTASAPTELRADTVIILDGKSGRLAVVVEVQLRYDAEKIWTWPAYLIMARLAHRCPAVLLVICLGSRTAQRCRAAITIGHPGCEVVPLVIDAATTPIPGDDGVTEAAVVPELVVLAVLTGALDMGQEADRRLVLRSLAGLDDGRLRTYTVFVLNATSQPDRKALEDLMAKTAFRNDFVDRLLAEGRSEGLAEGKAEGLAEGKAAGKTVGLAEGMARMVVRILAARGVSVPVEARQRILACTDAAQLEVWGDRAAVASSVEELFST